MTPLSARLRRGIGAAALVVLVGGCTHPDVVGDIAWGAEAVSYFDDLTAEHSRNDFYGVLDFYTPTAFIEKWRGDLRGGARVAEMLRWNSGDLDQTIHGVFLNSEGALTLVSWVATEELGAIVSTIDKGLIDRETVFDLTASLQRSLRASPEVIAMYEHLYTTYAAAWSGSDEHDIAALYSATTKISDSLSGLMIDGNDSIPIDGAPGRSVRPSGVTPEFASLYLGPVEYGRDPGRAVGVFDVTGESGCVHRVAVVWHVEDGLITTEDRYHDVESYPGCFAEPPDGWWTGLTKPAPSDEVITGVLRTPAGRDVDVHNGTPLLETVLHDAMGRYTAAGLAEPEFDAVIFEPSRKCADRSGRFIQSGGRRDLFICLFESDLCPGTGPCQEPGLAVRGTILHELAHAWAQDHITDELQSRLLEFAGLEAWQDEDLPWSEQGIEYTAEVIAWGLLGQLAQMVRIGNPSCDELAAAFRLLTDAEPLQNCATG